METEKEQLVITLGKIKTAEYMERISRIAEQHIAGESIGLEGNAQDTIRDQACLKIIQAIVQYTMDCFEEDEITLTLDKKTAEDLNAYFTDDKNGAEGFSFEFLERVKEKFESSVQQHKNKELLVESFGIFTDTVKKLCCGKNMEPDDLEKIMSLFLPNHEIGKVVEQPNLPDFTSSKHEDEANIDSPFKETTDYNSFHEKHNHKLKKTLENLESLIDLNFELSKHDEKIRKLFQDYHDAENEEKVEAKEVMENFKEIYEKMTHGRETSYKLQNEVYRGVLNMISLFDILNSRSSFAPEKQNNISTNENQDS